MKKFIVISCFFFLSLVYCETIIDGGPVSGHWAIENSPFLVQESIYIPQDSLLTIDPGVFVSFAENTGFGISGEINAQGTTTDSIHFAAPNGTWYGIQIHNNVHFSYCSFSSIEGYGIIVDSLSTFEFCLFDNITAEAAIKANDGLYYKNNVMNIVDGAGISASSTVHIENALFRNIDGACIYQNTSIEDSLFVSDSEFYDNHKGFHIVGENVGQIQMQNLTFQNNNFCYFMNDSNPTAENDLLLQNCLFSNNNYVFFSYHYSANFASCTISNNTNVANEPIQLYNSILNGNATIEHAEYSCLNPIPNNAIACINADSLFVNPIDAIGISDSTYYADWRLKENTAAINTGNPDNEFHWNTAFDLDSNVRIYNNDRIDIGAYEFQGDPTFYTTLFCETDSLDFGFVQVTNDTLLDMQEIRIWNLGTATAFIDSIKTTAPFAFRIFEEQPSTNVTDIEINPGTYIDLTIFVTAYETGTYSSSLEFISETSEYLSLPLHTNLVSETLIEGTYNTPVTISGNAIIQGNTYFNEGLTINGDTELQMTNGAKIFVTSHFIMQGTPENPILLNALHDYWKGIEIQDALVQLENISIRNVRDVDCRVLSLQNVEFCELENIKISYCSGFTVWEGEEGNREIHVIRAKNTTLRANGLEIFKIAIDEEASNNVRAIYADSTSLEMSKVYVRLNRTYADVAFGLHNSDLQLFNSTIDNINFGARIYDSNVKMVNTVLSSANYSFFYYSGEIRLYYCNVPDIEISIYEGSENPVDLTYLDIIDEESDYINIEQNDYGLLPTSGNINAGTPESWILPWNTTISIADYLGFECNGESYDIGAFEFIPQVDNAPSTSNFSASIYPNPFVKNKSREATTIAFNLPKMDAVDIAIYNLRGQKIRSFEEKKYEKGYHEINWNNKTDRAEVVSSGIYFCKIKTTAQQKIIKMTILK